MRIIRFAGLSLVVFSAAICFSGCASRKCSKPEVTIEEIEVRDAEVDHADQPVPEFESK